MRGGRKGSGVGSLGQGPFDLAATSVRPTIEIIYIYIYMYVYIYIYVERERTESKHAKTLLAGLVNGTMMKEYGQELNQ